MGLIKYIMGGDSRKSLKKLQKKAKAIDDLKPKYAQMTDAELRSMTAKFREEYKNGKSLDDILPDAFAALREASRRVLGMEHFVVQLIGGICLFQGRIAEMKTGEGKTLVATLPAYLEALAGKGVHVVTVNDYLARRDAEWMGKLYKFMGMTVGVVVPGMEDDEKRAAYNCDITYGTNNEFGFDYLRDNLKSDLPAMVQRELNFAIVDEVDSILIDEARTPLIISGRGGESSELYAQVDKFVRTLSGGFDDDLKEAEEAARKKKNGIGERKLAAAEELRWDYIVERKDKQVELTEYGAEKAEKFFGLENISDPENAELNHHIQQALKAHMLFHINEEYIIREGEIIIVDEFTGRLMFGRRYSDGLHQAIEAKEGVKIREENKTFATITFQNYFRLYKKLSGMTGTAKTEEGEFRTIYSLDVIEIPTHRPVRRDDLHDRIFSTVEGKKRAIVREISERHATGQPILVGTVSVEKSEEIARLLKINNIKCEILNAKNHENEAKIVAQAGRYGAVTISTNMAGRGTDILLGGNPDYLAREELRGILAREMYEQDKESADEARKARREREKRGGEAEAEDAEEAERKEREKERARVISEKIELATSFAETDDEETLRLRALYRKAYEKHKAVTDEEKQRVVAAGGLCIIGTERHESRRIDNQLRGRSGRQGDPGVSIFFLSLEDDLMVRFGGERMKSIYQMSKMQEDESLESKLLTRLIEYAQKQIEGRNFGIRKNVLQYDDVMNKQRMIMYAERMNVIRGADVHDQILKYIPGYVNSVICKTVNADDMPEKWNEDELNAALEQQAFIAPGTGYVTRERLERWDFETALEKISARACKAYEERIAHIEEEFRKEYPTFTFADVERRVLLRTVDINWIDHIDAMDRLRKGIRLRAYGQTDPVIAYKQEGFAMFDEMVERIQRDTILQLLSVRIQINRRPVERVLPTASAPTAPASEAPAQNAPEQPSQPAQGGQAPARSVPPRMQGAVRGPMLGGPAPVDVSKLRTSGSEPLKSATVRKEKKPLPNDPCPCGSGLKYKKCHGRQE